MLHSQKSKGFYTIKLLLLLLSCFNRVQLCVTPETAAYQAPHPWNSSGKNTRVGCHFLLQCMKVKRESEVAQLCPIPRDPMDCSLPGSYVHGICQAIVLEWVAIAFSTSKASLGKILLQARSELRGQNLVPWGFRIQDFTFMVSVSLWPPSALTACSQVLGTWGSQYSYLLPQS